LFALLLAVWLSPCVGNLQQVGQRLFLLPALAALRVSLTFYPLAVTLSPDVTTVSTFLLVHDVVDLAPVPRKQQSAGSVGVLLKVLCRPRGQLR